MDGAKCAPGSLRVWVLLTLLDVIRDVGFSDGSLPRMLDRLGEETLDGGTAGGGSVPRRTAQGGVSIVQRRLQHFPPRIEIIEATKVGVRQWHAGISQPGRLIVDVFDQRLNG